MAHFRAIVRRLLRDLRGATAAEFALILPALILLTLGTINLCLMLYTVVTLHFAVEDAARCASVSLTCPTAAATETFAAAQYKGPTLTPTFVATSDTVSNTVTGTASYVFSTGLTSTTIPLSAKGSYAKK
jgi:Flp pilus assembly protein TadG